MTYKEIDWKVKSEDDIYDYYDGLKPEEKYPFLKWLCLHKEGLDFDWFSMLGDRHELVPKDDVAVCEDFVAWFPEKFPQEYAEEFPFVERDLCSYYLFKGDLPKLRKRIVVVADDPVTGIDTVTLRLYYQLVYYGYHEEAVAYAEKIFEPVHHSSELIGRSEGVFVQGIYFNALQQAYEKYKQTEVLDFSELKKMLPKYDLKEEVIEATIESTALQNELNTDALLSKFKSNYIQGYTSLKMHFLKYMYEQYQTPFILAEEIWDVVGVKDIFGQSEDPEASFFYMDTQKFDKILDERIDHFMHANQLEMFGKVWGLFYVVEFLKAKGLISEEEAIRMQENATYFRNQMMIEVGDELWQMNFVFKWPGNERWKDLKLIFESTYIQTAQDANKMIQSFINSQPVNKRINKELAIEEKRMRQDFFNPNKEPYVKSEPKVGRNDPCPCGSGKKYKKCCMNK